MTTTRTPRSRARLLLAGLVLAAGGPLVGVVPASAHGGDITIDVTTSVSGTTATFHVHLTWADGHDVTGQGVQVTATGPGTRSAFLPATNSAGRTSGSIALSDGTWSVAMATDGGDRTIGVTIGTPTSTQPPATSPPATPAPTTVAAAVAPTAPGRATPTTRAAIVTTTTARGLTSTSSPGPTPSTTGSAAGATVPSTTSANGSGGGSIAGSSTVASTGPETVVDEAASRGSDADTDTDTDDGGSTLAWWLGGTLTAAGAAGAATARLRRRRA